MPAEVADPRDAFPRIVADVLALLDASHTAARREKKNDGHYHFGMHVGRPERVQGLPRADRRRVRSDVLRHHAPPHFAKWAEEHPGWSIVRWKCQPADVNDI